MLLKFATLLRWVHESLVAMCILYSITIIECDSLRNATSTGDIIAD